MDWLSLAARRRRGLIGRPPPARRRRRINRSKREESGSGPGWPTRIWRTSCPTLCRWWPTRSGRWQVSVALSMHMRAMVDIRLLSWTRPMPNAFHEDAGHGHGPLVCPSLQRVECQQIRPAAEQCAGEDVVDFVVAQCPVEVVAVEGREVPAGQYGPDVDNGLDLMALQQIREPVHWGGSSGRWS